MKYRIEVYPTFKREFKRLHKRYRSLKEDLLKLSEELLINPTQGVDLGNGLYKVRMAISSKGKGKSAGTRVITLILAISEEESEIGLHIIYDKSECDNISDKELMNTLKQNGVL